LHLANSLNRVTHNNNTSGARSQAIGFVRERMTHPSKKQPFLTPSKNEMFKISIKHHVLKKGA